MMGLFFFKTLKFTLKISVPSELDGPFGILFYVINLPTPHAAYYLRLLDKVINIPEFQTRTCLPCAIRYEILCR